MLYRIRAKTGAIAKTTFKTCSYPKKQVSVIILFKLTLCAIERLKIDMFIIEHIQSSKLTLLRYDNDIAIKSNCTLKQLFVYRVKKWK